MIKAIIVEDEKPSAENLQMILQAEVPEVKLLGFANSVKTAINLLSTNDVDLVFLDIELGDGTAFELLKSLSNIKFNIIFTTAFETYAIKAIKFNALDYLLKPIDIEELKQAVKKYQSASNNHIQEKLKHLLENIQQHKVNKIAIPTHNGFQFIEIKDIIWIKSSGNYSELQMTGKKESIVSSRSLKEYDELLNSNGFLRIHNSYTINLDHIEKYVKGVGGYVVLDNGEKIEVSRRKKEHLIDIIEKSMS
ncbi:MAG: response regulator transcription factor [Bacteroidia bacterium]|nr:response regulator transcription factor [Bacteroidia bacterium]